MLVCYARELKEGFAPYTEQVVKLMVPLLKFYFHDLVRTAAAESLPYILECAKIKGEAYVRQMWAYMCPEVLKAMSAEPEPEVQILIMNALAQCIETLGVGCMTPDYFNELATMLHDIIEMHKNRQVERQRKYYNNFYPKKCSWKVWRRLWAGLLTNSKNEILTWCQEPLKQGGRVSGQNLQHFTLNFDL